MIFSIPHNKRVKLRNFGLIGRKGGHRIEHPFETGVNVQENS
jgi:hypothetical protein